MKHTTPIFKNKIGFSSHRKINWFFEGESFQANLNLILLHNLSRLETWNKWKSLARALPSVYKLEMENHRHDKVVLKLLVRVNTSQERNGWATVGELSWPEQPFE